MRRKRRPTVREPSNQKTKNKGLEPLLFRAVFSADPSFPERYIALSKLCCMVRFFVEQTGKCFDDRGIPTQCQKHIINTGQGTFVSYHKS